MGTFYRFMLACVVLCILVVPTGLKAESPQKFPNVVGTWVDNHYKAYFYTGPQIGRNEFRIKEQDGPYFKGVHQWKQGDGKPLAMKKGKPINADTEPLVGVIGFDGESITMAEQDDTGVLHGKLVGKDTMLLIYEEPGSNAVVIRLELKREP
jgi:hypothetical protein